jgi:hypothetical protein
MFLNPLMLAGIGGAAIPLILHLLSRARFRTIDWPAMMFLEPATARRRQGLRLRNLLILLLRMSIVALLAIALARPVVHGAWGEGATVTAVIILDRSASMAVQDAGVSRFDRAKEAAIQVIATLRRGDRVYLLTTGDEPAPPSDPTTDLQALAAKITSLTVAPGEADVAETLSKAADLLDQSRGARELYLITDRQAVSFRHLDAAFAQNWQQRNPSPNRPRFITIPIGGEQVDNVAIRSITLLSPPAISGQPAHFAIDVRNYSKLPRTNLPLTISTSNRELATTTVNLPPEGAATVNISTTFYNPRSTILSAAVKAPGMALDARMDYALQIIPPLHVLFISGDERQPPEDVAKSESAYAHLAIAPFSAAGKSNTDIAAVTVVRSIDFPPDLSSYNIIFLANDGDLTDVQARALEQFVFAGGGLFIAPGNLVDPQRYAHLLPHVLPATLSAPTSSDGAAATTIATVTAPHPIFAPFNGSPMSAAQISIARFFPAAPVPGAQILANYQSGQPFLLESHYGRGKVLLMTTPLDADWSSLPLSDIYVPLLQSSVKFLATTQSSHNLNLGDPLIAEFPEPGAHTAAVETPDEKSQPVDIVSVAGRPAIIFGNTSQVGAYTIRYHTAAGERSLQYIVRAPQEEADLTALTPQRWDELAASLNFDTLDTARTPIDASLSGRRRGRELWGYLLIGVLLLGAAELFAERSDARRRRPR